MSEVAEECGMEENEGREEAGTLQKLGACQCQASSWYLINVSQSYCDHRCSEETSYVGTPVSSGLLSPGMKREHCARQTCSGLPQQGALRPASELSKVPAPLRA